MCYDLGVSECLRVYDLVRGCSAKEKFFRCLILPFVGRCPFRLSPWATWRTPCSSKDFEICLSRGQEFADIDEKNMEFEKMWMTPRPVRGRAWSTSDQAGDTCSNLEFCWMDHRAHLATVVPVVGSFLMLSSCLMVRFSQSSLQINTLWLVQH